MYLSGFSWHVSKVSHISAKSSLPIIFSDLSAEAFFCEGLGHKVITHHTMILNRLQLDLETASYLFCVSP